MLLVKRLNAARKQLPAPVGTLTRVMAGFIASFLVLATVIGTMGTTDHRYELQAFAIPAQDQTPALWVAEVDDFAHKVNKAFGVRRSTAQEFSGWILEASERHELSPELIASVVLTESSFRKRVRSHVGAIGPAQVRPEYWGRFCGADIRDPAENIYCGAQILAHLKDSCGGYDCALSAYNVGRYSKRRAAAKRYIAKVGKHLDRLSAL